MLLAIRERLTGWIAYVIVILISIPFALWGVQQYFGNGEDAVAAKVNDAEIPARQLEYEYARQRQALLEQFGGNLPPGMLESLDLKQQVLDRMVEDELLAQTTAEHGYRIGDGHLASVIRSFEAFSENGAFSSTAYEAQLRSQGMSTAQFERRVRRALRSEQFQKGVVNTAFATEAAVEDFYRLRHQQREIETVTLPVASVADDVAVSEDQVKAYYEANPEAFRAPERVKLAYVELSAEKLADTISVDEATVERLYQEYRSRAGAQEIREARHILVEVPQDADPAAVEQARQEIEALRKQIQDGASFAEVAREHSDDPGSAKQGGSLGQIERGQMVEPFEETLFALEPGQLSEPVRTRFGFHLIRVAGIESQQPKRLAEVRDQLVADYRLKEAENIFYDQAERLATLSYEQPDSLVPVAEQLGLEVQQSGWISQSTTEGLGSHEKVRRAAFSQEVLEDRLNSELLELGPNRAVVVRVAEHRPASQQPLEKVRDQVEAAVRQERTDELLTTRADELREQWVDGADGAALATEYEGEYNGAKTIDRQSQDPSATVVARAFAMGPETQGESAYAVARGNDGARTVIRLRSVQDADVAEMETEEREAIRNGLMQRNGSEAFAAVMKVIRGQAEIERSDNL